MLCRLFLASLLFVTLQNRADAFVTRINVRPADQTTLPGYTTYEVTVSGSDELKGGTGELVGMEMLLELEEGTFYTFPSTPLVVGTIEGGAVNLGGGTELTFNESLLDVAWSFSPQYAPNNYFVGQFIVSESAYGSLKILGKTAGEPSYLFDYGLFPCCSDPSVFSFPSENTIFSLDMSIMNTGGVLTDAIELMEGFGGPTMVTSVSLADGTFFAAEDVVGMPINGNNTVGIDLSFIGSAMPGYPVGSIVTDELIVQTEFDVFRYTLAATVPIPEPGGGFAAMFGLAAAALIRRQYVPV